MHIRTNRLVFATVIFVVVSGCSLFEHKRHGGVQPTAVELNTASRKQLDRLPGLTPADVDRIVKNRPYAKKHDLLDRGVLDKQKFDAIRDDVYVEAPSKR